MRKLIPWMHAIRPKTLPLALSSSILGSFIAAADGLFRWSVFVLAASTSLLLQVLSNLANDYGDFAKGTDTPERIGPARMVQTGAITPRQMVWAIAAVSIMTFASGSLLIFEGLGGGHALLKVIFFLLGLTAIGAAINYTVGKNPYGYSGFGDVFVFLFFGLLGVMGTYYLHAHVMRLDLLLPATSIGLLSAGVLNLNNLRDVNNDIKTHKHTLVVMMGSSKAKVYHLLLVVVALITGGLYIMLHYHTLYQLLFVITILPLTLNVRAVFTNRIPAELNNELKRLSLSTLLFSVTFGMGLLL